ncbi:unnamed protein product [Durusdinium trenchii]|uniref:Uncharacterized protein n=1 Tax=Durusdinium trenchii TaxID=1381693 RepID=A0ABP0ST93_9DINO
MEPSCASRAKRAKRARESCPSLPFSVLEDASYPSLGGCRGLLSADGHEAVVALIESRSREVGLAGVCCRSMEFELTQFSDTTSYSRTTSAVLAADPSAVLVSGKRSHL